METRRRSRNFRCWKSASPRPRERFAHLKDQYQAMQDQRTSLEAEIDRLQSANRELNEKINHLKTNHDKILSSFHKEEVRKRIDRVLETARRAAAVAGTGRLTRC